MQSVSSCSLGERSRWVEWTSNAKLKIQESSRFSRHVGVLFFACLVFIEIRFQTARREREAHRRHHVYKHNMKLIEVKHTATTTTTSTENAEPCLVRERRYLQYTREEGEWEYEQKTKCHSMVWCELGGNEGLRPGGKIEFIQMCTRREWVSERNLIFCQNRFIERFVVLWANECLSEKCKWSCCLVFRSFMSFHELRQCRQKEKKYPETKTIMMVSYLSPAVQTKLAIFHHTLTSFEFLRVASRSWVYVFLRFLGFFTPDNIPT